MFLLTPEAGYEYPLWFLSLSSHPPFSYSASGETIHPSNCAYVTSPRAHPIRNMPSRHVREVARQYSWESALLVVPFGGRI